MKYIVSAALFLALAANVQAQFLPEISSPDFIFYLMHNPNVISTFQSNDPKSYTAYVGAPDTNVVWNFQTTSYTELPHTMLPDTFMLPAGAALAKDTDFSGSDVVVATVYSKLTQRYRFFDMSTDGGAYFQGITEFVDGNSRKVIGWNPPIQEAHYPMNYQTAWQSFSNVDGDTLAAGERRTVSLSSVADSWGGLLLPGMVDPWQCLRVHEVRIETDYMNEQIVSIDTTVKYHFYTSGLLSATITTDTHNNILDVVYTTGFLAPSSVHDRPTTAFGLSVADNPVTNTRTTVRYTLPADAPVTIEVMDMLGNSVRVLQEGMQSAGSHTSSLDLGTLPNGAYFVRMESAGASEMQKMIVSK